MSIACPKCQQTVPGTEINVQANLAKCPSCHHLFKPSELLAAEAAAPPKKVSVTPPPGSRITMNTRGGASLTLTAPRPRFSIANLGILIFSIFWLGFITIWTALALFGGGSFMALFSIPFWAVGIFMFLRGYRAIVTRQELEITSSEFTLTRIRPGVRRAKTFPLDEVLKAQVKEEVTYTKSKSGYRHAQINQVPYIIRQSGKTKFFETQSQSDKEWAVAFINQFLTTKRGTL